MRLRRLAVRAAASLSAVAFLFFSTVTLSAEMRAAKTASSIAPVWAEVATRMTSEEILRATIELAGTPVVTSDMVEARFGIRFKQPRPYSKMGVIYVAEGDDREDGQHFSILLRNQKPAWILTLAGFNDPDKEHCVLNADALAAFKSAGWKPEQVPGDVRDFQYVRRTPDFTSVLVLPGIEEYPQNCFNAIHIYNWPTRTGRRP